MAADIIPLLPAYGASPDDWAHFDLILGLTADLLPVVSNPRAVISPDSGLKEPGKTPSQYNVQRQVAGLAKWTQRRTTPADIARWQRERDYGICLQTRTVRALDNDITDSAAARRIEQFTIGVLGLQLPKRCRANSAKFLQAFELPGDYTKRRIKTPWGVIEFLATGQQFVAVGTHPSGVRYEWEGGLPDAFPTLTPEQFEHLWTALEQEFGTEDAATSRPSTKHQRLADVHEHDPVARHLLDSGRVLKAERDGRLHITCPWEHEHTTQTGESATTYWPAHTGGYALGHFRCLHAHCEHRTDDEFQAAVGYAPTDEFRAIVDEVATPPGESSDEPVPITDETPKPARFTPQPAHVFAIARAMPWLIKGVIPWGQLCMFYGESGAGKTFAVLDMAYALSSGEPWRGHKVRAGLRVIYVCAEGAGGFRLRLRALAQGKGVDLADIRISVIADAPNLLEKADAVALAKAIVAAGGADVIIIDTLAQATPGANENSSEDMGKALAHCRGLHIATGAMVVLVHHAGKDTSKGSRGWSGIKGAADVEIEVVRAEEARSLVLRKVKDGPKEGAEFPFRLASVVLGIDEDGDEVTSCAVEQVTEEGHRSATRRRALGPVGHLTLNMLQSLCGVANEWVEGEALLAAVVEQMPFDGGRDTRRQRAKRCRDDLAAQGVIESSPLGFRIAEG